MNIVVYEQKKRYKYNFCWRHVIISFTYYINYTLQLIPN